MGSESGSSAFQAMPKSARYAGPEGDLRRRLDGLMSRWRIPREWQCARAVKREWRWDLI